MKTDNMFPAVPKSEVLSRAEALLKRLELIAHETRVLAAQGRMDDALFAFRKEPEWAHEIRVLLRQERGDF